MGDVYIKPFVMPGLIRHPVFSWIPAFAGMTVYAIQYVSVYNKNKSENIVCRPCYSG